MNSDLCEVSREWNQTVSAFSQKFIKWAGPIRFIDVDLPRKRGQLEKVYDQIMKTGASVLDVSYKGVDHDRAIRYTFKIHV